MTSSDRSTQAMYTFHNKITVETKIGWEERFSGIMFPVWCNNYLVIQHIDIHHIAVCGQLGCITVWVSNKEASLTILRAPLDPYYWTKLHVEMHAPSQNDLVPLLFNSPI